LFVHRRWHRAGDVAIDGADTTRTTCPACRTIEAGIPRGFVHIEGAFPRAHAAEVRRLLDNEERRATEDNPLARTMGRTEEPDGKVIVTTTTEHLAQRLGQALEKAFGGEVRYDFSHENKLARVYWRRD
jgi:hypothetical protein